MPNWGASATGAAKGAAMGSIVGPWGTAIGAAAGFFGGLFSKKKKPAEVAPTTTAGGIGGGGISPINYDAIRERSIAPTRGIYQNAMRDLRRQPGMGISSPGYGAQLTALGRGMSSQLSDASLGAEGEIGRLRLSELGQNQQYAYNQQQLENEKKRLPSSLDKGVSTAGNILGLIGQGVGVAKGMGIGAPKPLDV